MKRMRLSPIPEEDYTRKYKEKVRRATNVPIKGSPEYRDNLTRKHGPEGDCKCPVHVKARAKRQ